MKSRFLSNMSHEFRTPLNSVRALCGLLPTQSIDGCRSPREQETQVKFYREGERRLDSELLNDLLDLAKIEAGKVGRCAGEPSRSTELFSALARDVEARCW